MLKHTLVTVIVASTWIGATAVNAQTPAETEAQIREVVEARTQMERARQELEQAARVIATQSVVPVQNHSDDVHFLYDAALGSYRFTGQGRLGLTIVEADGGALVTTVSDGSGAQEAGIRVGDVIQSINGTDLTSNDVPSVQQLRDILGEVEPGATVVLVVERAGQTREFEVETSERPGWVAALSPDQYGFRALTLPTPAGSGPAVTYGRVADPGWTFGFSRSPWADMELVALTEGLGRYFDTSEGLLVVSGPEDDAIDIQDGDVILAISGRVPNSPEHAIRILSSFERGETVEFSIMRDGRRQSIEYTMPEPAAGRFPGAAQSPPAAPGTVVVPSPD